MISRPVQARPDLTRHGSPQRLSLHISEMAFLFPSLRSAVASSSNSSAASSSSSCRALLRPTFLVPPVVASSGTTATYGQSRGIKFAPKRTKHGMNAMKGRVPIHIGGSTKGTTLAYGGEYGIRATNGVRIKAKQLEAAYEALRRKMKPFKGVEIIMRVFPDRPVTAKVSCCRAIVSNHYVRLAC